MEKNNTLQVIYTYLINYANNKDILELANALREYAINGSFVDYAITTTDYSDMFEEMVRNNLYTSKDSIQNMIYALENIRDEYEY